MPPITEEPEFVVDSAPSRSRGGGGGGWGKIFEGCLGFRALQFRVPGFGV